MKPPFHGGRELLAIPGPTAVPDRVLAAMQRPAIDIYAGELHDITARCLEGLKRAFRTRGEVYIYAANGHGGWEAALANVLAAGDRALALESGLFVPAWSEMARSLGIEVETLAAEERRAICPARLAERLAADRQGAIRAVLVAQVDTASGIQNDIAAIGRAMDEAGHDALLMVDAVASLVSTPFAMDDWRVDVAVAGSQKGLMSPPGLAFVAAGERARRRRQALAAVPRYWDWAFRDGPEHYMKYCGTAPEHMLFALNEALDMLFEEGLAAAIARHDLLARATRAAVGGWSEGGALEFNALDAKERANAVTTVRVNGIDPAPLLEFCRQRLGVVLGIGIGPGLSGRAFRIAHMGHVNAAAMLGTLGCVETALAALAIPHGGGLAAATAGLAGLLRPFAAGEERREPLAPCGHPA